MKPSDRRWAAMKLQQLWRQVALRLETDARLTGAMAMQAAERLRERAK
jgi:hypothetical protein